jgi:hypothetical protein
MNRDVFRRHVNIRGENGEEQENQAPARRRLHLPDGDEQTYPAE